MRATRVKSAALSTVEYRRLAPADRAAAPGCGFLIVRFRHGGKRAYLCPSQYAGLFAAAKAQHRSVGKLYNRIVRGKCASVNMEGVQ